MALTRGELRELLDYDKTTGILTWKISPRANVKAGQEAGSIDGNVRRMVMIHGQGYHAGRLIWLWVTGDWPKGIVDHQDRNSLNNRWLNLRDVTQAVNMQNRTVNKSSKSGIRGVYQFKGTKKWHVQIGLNKKRIHIGFFNSFNEAVAARKAAEQKYYVQPLGGVS